MSIFLVNARVAKNDRAFVSAYRRSLKLVAGRIRRGQSLRRQAAKLKMSHEGLRKLMKNPDSASRKTMLKIVRAVMRPKKQVPRLRGLWYGDAL